MKLRKIFLHAKKTCGGFTLIEILITLSIIVVLAGLGLFLGFDVYRGYAFRYERNVAVSILQKARSEAMNNINQLPHGVRIEDSSYIVFQGSTFDSTTSTNIRIPISKSVAVGGTNEIIFDELSGDVTTPGTITLTNGVRTTNITINNVGRIDW